MIVIQPSPKTVGRVRGDHLCDQRYVIPLNILVNPVSQLSFMHWRSRNLGNKEGGRSNSRGGSTLGEDILKDGLPRWFSDKRTHLLMQEMQETWIWSLGREDPWRRKWWPTPMFLSGEARGGGWVTVRGVTESDTAGHAEHTLPRAFWRAAWTLLPAAREDLEGSLSLLTNHGIREMLG